VLIVARLAKEKNLDLGLAAFARLGLQGTRLAIVGAGPERERLETAAARLGIAGRTTFAGEFSRAELPDCYASADAFLFTSQSETQGLVLVEALAAGLPVVAVDTPQTRDVVGTGPMLAAPDADALAAALRTVLEARRRIEASGAWRFDQGTVADRLVGVYDSLLPAVSQAG
jgi:glycosyltransferase involved in cell wall biosynthesis